MGMVEMTELEVLSPGMYTTAQDAGRFGYLDKGVPPAGPMDFFAFSLANALVGNLSENVVDDPHVVAIALLLSLQIAEDLAIVVSLQREKHLADDAGLQQLA